MALVYDQPTEQLQSGIDSPSVQNKSGEGVQRAGAAAVKAAAVQTDIFVDHENTVDTARAKEADNYLADTIQTVLYDPKSGYLSKPGKAALDTQEATLSALKNTIEDIGPTLENDTQRAMFNRVAQQRLRDATGQVYGHSMKEAKVYDLTESKGRVDKSTQGAVNSFFGWKDSKSQYNTYKAQVIAGVEDVAKQTGAGPEQTEQMKLEALTKLHTDVINQMKSQDLGEEAEEYFKEAVKRKEIDPEVSDDLRTKVQESALLSKADNAATDIFAGKNGPKSQNDAVRMFDMEQEARKLAGKDEKLQAQIIAGLRDRASAFNAQQTEVKAVNVGNVWDQVDAGIPMTKIENSEAWAALTGTERDAIRSRIEADALSKENRRLSASQRQLAEIQIQEKLLFNKNGEKFLDAIDPDFLMSISRDSAKALRSLFGQQAAEFIVNRWDDLRKNSQKIVEAKMDQDDFYNIASKNGIDPFNTKQRDKLADLRFHTEQIIDLEQRKKGNVPLTRKEKWDLVNKEVAKKVLIYRPILSNVDRPVFLLTPEEKKKIIVPDDKKAAITARMMRVYNETGNPMFAPTPENLRREYLILVSPAAATEPEGIE